MYILIRRANVFINFVNVSLKKLIGIIFVKKEG